MSAQFPAVFALTTPDGNPTIAALIGPSELLAYSSYAHIMGEQFTLADGNTATVVDVPRADSGDSYSLLHLATPEAATPLNLAQLQGTASISGILAPANGPSTSESFTISDTNIIRGDETGQYTPAAFLSPDGTTLYGLSSMGSTGALGLQAVGNALTTQSLRSIQPWLAADASVPTQPTTPQNVAVHDNTTNTDLPDTSTAYSGPVAGITSQFMDATPDNLNVAAKADNLFIKTGSGNDAIALHGGTNVVDAGGGSNFLTSGGGFDTFFLDTRNIPAASSAAGPVPGAIWDTIQNFGHGDAATLWGIGPGTALAWQRNEGAVGHTGLTLHAIAPNGAATSLTLAGVDSTAHLALSYGQSGGANYLYVKAV